MVGAGQNDYALGRAVRKVKTKTLNAGFQSKYTHRWLDACDLAMARLIVEKIQGQPELMRVAVDNLRRWKKQMRPWPPALREWEIILANNPTERVLEILVQDNEEGQRLRQSDPFVGILTEEERLWFLESYDQT
jgi:hypothetical protein